MREPQPARIRWWDLPAVLVLTAALMTAAMRLVATEWTSHLGITVALVMLGMIAGLALGASRFGTRVVAALASAYGAFFIVWRLGSTIDAELIWPERIYVLLARLGVIFRDLSLRRPVSDSLLFLILMTVIFWVLGAYAGYSLTRHGSAWRAIIPGGLTVIMIHTYDALLTERGWFLVAFIFFALLLVARMAYIFRLRRWQEHRAHLPLNLSLDFIRSSLIITTLVVTFAWTLPVLADSIPAAQSAWRIIRQPWNEFKSSFEDAFASLRSSVGVITENFGDSMNLGRGSNLSDTVVMRVQVPTSAAVGTRYYWRARVYDFYDGREWSGTQFTGAPFNPVSPEFIFPELEGRTPTAISFVSLNPISTLYTAAQPEWVSTPGRAEVSYNPDGTVEISSFQASPVIRAGDTYQVRASVATVTISELRAAGTEYPEWITQRYLQLPDSVTERTRQLAQEITAGLETPYDRVATITNYLRFGFQYRAFIDPPPANQELVDWFLFDIKEGFCNYYASAQVVMLRSLGIPARLAVGYAQGELEQAPSGAAANVNTYVVRQRDLHAWPEVYFPGIGWVEFEPTAAQPLLARPGGAGAQANLPDPVDPEEVARAAVASQNQRQQEEQAAAAAAAASPAGIISRVLSVALPILGAAIVLYVLWRSRERIRLPSVPILLESSMVKIGLRPPAFLRRWARQAALPPLARAYMQINYALGRLGSSPQKKDTPAERARALGQIIPETRPPAERLVSEYQTATYSMESPDVPAAQQAGTQVRNLSFKAWLRRLFTEPVQPKTTRPKRRRRWW